MTSICLIGWLVVLVTSRMRAFMSFTMSRGIVVSSAGAQVCGVGAVVDSAMYQLTINSVKSYLSTIFMASRFNVAVLVHEPFQIHRSFLHVRDERLGRPKHPVRHPDGVLDKSGHHRPG